MNEINTTVENTVSTNITLEDRVENIEGNVSSIMQADLFLVAFIVVIVVCFLLYKVIDNFISF